MVEGVLKEVLIKECGNSFHDKVFVVENLPKKFLFEKTAKLIPVVDKEGFKDGSVAPDPSGEMIETLYPGIEKSATGDGGYVFWMESEDAKQRLQDIDRYIDRTLPRDARLVRRVLYAQLVGESSSPPMPYHQIARVVLPAPELELQPAPATHFPRTEAPESLARKTDKRKTMSPERLAKLRANIAKAQAARKAALQAA